MRNFADVNYATVDFMLFRRALDQYLRNIGNRLTETDFIWSLSPPPGCIPNSIAFQSAVQNLHLRCMPLVFHFGTQGQCE